MAVIRAQEIVVAAGAHTVLKSCSCELRAGEVLGICGPNGAGKSTLLRVLAGLQPVVSGQLEFGPQNLQALSLQERAIRIGYLPQAPDVAWPITVRELAELGRFPHGTQPAHLVTALVTEAIRKVGLSTLSERLLESLSGGERTRAHLARLLAGHHQAILADEPIAALDPRYQLEILQILRALAGAGTAVALVLHDLALAARYCDRVLVLHAGRLVASGIPDQIMTPALLTEVFNIRGVWDPDTHHLLGFASLA